VGGEGGGGGGGNILGDKGGGEGRRRNTEAEKDLNLPCRCRAVGLTLFPAFVFVGVAFFSKE
jgi:hypothetical protein